MHDHMNVKIQNRWDGGYEGTVTDATGREYRVRVKAERDEKGVFTGRWVTELAVDPNDGRPAVWEAAEIDEGQALSLILEALNCAIIEGIEWAGGAGWPS